MLGMHAGDTEAKILAVFARLFDPAFVHGFATVIIFDDLDHILQDAPRESHWNIRAQNTLLSALDTLATGCVPISNVLILASTSKHPGSIAQRFDQVIHLANPDEASRQKAICNYLDIQADHQE
jgi:SpoVK/Ycf46/Vps4 family AAA+-type ATPase